MFMKKASIAVAMLVIAGCAPTTASEPSTPRIVPPSAFRPFTFPEPTPLVVVEDVKDTFVRDFKRVEPKTKSKPVVVKKEPKPKVHHHVVVAVPKSAAKKYAFSKLGATQYGCIDAVFERESHWNYKSYNRSSGAYGIPQAVPGRKMATFGSDWRTNPITQVRWGIHYVNGRYGSACGAWHFWQTHHWY